MALSASERNLDLMGPWGPFRRASLRVGSARTALVIGVLWFSACQSDVSLGGECAANQKCTEGGGPLLPPDSGGMNGEQDGSTGAVDAGGARLDASTGDAELPDAGFSDAHVGVDANGGQDSGEADSGEPPGLFPDLANPSFERTSGTGAGDLNLGAEMAPWYHCLPPVNLGFLRAEQNTDGVTPTDDAYFLAYGYPFVVDLPVPIYQELATPLKAGTRYAFMIDVQSKSGDDELGLIVRGGNVRCVATATLAVTSNVPNGQWVSQCVTFTPNEDLSHIAFLPNNKNGITVTNRFFLDNIRADPRCK